MIRILFALILIILMAGNAFCAATATQVDFLLAGLERNGSPLSGGKVATFEAGTNTAKECWTDREKTSSATNPVVLSSEGRATVFCDGVYKFRIATSADVTILTMDGVSYGPQGVQFTTLSSYASLSEAIADIGVNPTVLIIDVIDTLNANVTVPTNVTLVFLKDNESAPLIPGIIFINNKTLTINGAIQAPPMILFIGPGTLAGSPIVHYWDAGWLSTGVVAVTDTTTPSYKSLLYGGGTFTGALIANSTSTFNEAVSFINTSTFYNSTIFNTTTTFNDKTSFINTVVWNKGSDLTILNGTSLDLNNDGNYFDVTNDVIVNAQTTIAFVDSDPDTITDSGNGLAGFGVGEKVHVVGSTNNDGTYLINTVLAGTLTLDAGVTLTAEGASASVSLYQTIETIDTEGVGTVVKLHFDGAVSLINSTDLELIGADDITTLSGDEYEFIEYASGDWRMTASSNPVIANGLITGDMVAVTSFTEGSHTAGGGGEAWHPPEGVYNFASDGSAIFEILIGGTWYGSVVASGVVYCDGTNMRILLGASVTVYFQKF